MRVLATAVFFMMFHAPITAQVHFVEGSIHKQPRTITIDGRSVELDEESFQASVALPGSPTPGQIDVIMLYDPSRGLLWWHYLLGEPGQAGEIDRFVTNSVFYVLNSKIVCFMFQSRSLWVGESTAHYSSLAEGRARVLATIKSRLEEISTGRLSVFRKVDLGRTLPFTFYELNGNSNPIVGPAVRTVSRVDGHWQVTVNGPNGDSAVVVLSDKYDVMNAHILPKTSH